MEFEFDPAKSLSNKDKHGIDFEEAKALWRDDNLFELDGAFEGEARRLVIGWIGETHWTAIVTCRDDWIRLISVRRARDLEMACYEG
ncbi:MAG: BrnT family toxin [Proteobacteria bacterium]|nr:BrnT family toxin [Pseudomonadota bacterium]